MKIEHIRQTDPAIADAVTSELRRQEECLELIPSENHASKAVMEAMGTVLTNKYSEGYPGKRYYGGNEFIDVVESLAIERAKKLFGVDHANVQTHSGSSANIAAYFSILELKDKVLGMNLAHGGHLTHGHQVNFSGQFYNFSAYGVDQETEMLDMDSVRKAAIEAQPKLIVAGASAYPRTINFKEFRNIADEVGAKLMVDMAHIAGMIAAKIHPDPAPYADIITSTTHKTLRGPRGGLILSNEEHAKGIDKAVFPGTQGGPLNHVIAAKAICFQEALQPSFTDYQKQIVSNAKALAESLLDEGLRLVSGGTDNHLILIDLTKQEVSGKKAEAALDLAGITTNKNMIPFDTRSPFNPSGIRIGTPCLTTRGMKESEMKQVGVWMAKIINNVDDEQKIKSVRAEVLDLCKQFPVYSK